MYTALSLVIGAIIGALAVIFSLQNVAIVTVSFLSWQVTGSLALVLLATLLSGVVVTLLILLPSLIRDDINLVLLKRQKKELEAELARYRTAAHTTVVTAPASTL